MWNNVSEEEGDDIIVDGKGQIEYVNPTTVTANPKKTPIYRYAPFFSSFGNSSHKILFFFGILVILITVVSYLYSYYIPRSHTTKLTRKVKEYFDFITMNKQ